MKKIIILTALAVLMFSGAGCNSNSKSKKDKATISMMATVQKIEAGEDCWYNEDKTAFYVVAHRDENGRPAVVYAYRIVN